MLAPPYLKSPPVMTSRTHSLLRRLFSPAITVWSRFSQCFRPRPGSDSDSTGGLREPDDVEKSLHEQDDASGILREQDDIVGDLQKPNGVERGPCKPADLERSPCEVSTTTTPPPKRRALLVGISYKNSPPDRNGRKLEELDGHRDVERFRALLLSEYSLRSYFAFVTTLGAHPYPRYLQISPRRHHRT
jgi:hypothetical protein